MSFVHLADISGYATARTQGRFADMLIDVVSGGRYDELSKTSALVTLAIAAPKLTKAAATRALERLLPIAGGEALISAPPVITDHPNPKRSRTQFVRTVAPSAVRATAIQACGRLAQRAAPRSKPVESMLRSALATDEPDLLRMSLRELGGLGHLGRDLDPAQWLDHQAPAVRSAAEDLVPVRSGEPSP